MSSFSERQGLQPKDAEISIRHEAPGWLREFVIERAYDAGFAASELRSWLCRVLLEEPERDNWSSQNIDREVGCLLSKAEWFYVYDLIEWVYLEAKRRKLSHYSSGSSFSWETAADTPAGKFAAEVNRAFRQKGIGWQLLDGRVQMRGPEVFEEFVHTAIKLTEQSKRSVARNELSEALKDLSRRPEPEVTGAIQHSMAALECIAKDVTNDQKLTLGAWIKNNPDKFPTPLDTVVDKLWGYASQYGRHVKEGHPANFDEAEMTVGIVGALSTYLLRKAGS